MTLFAQAGDFCPNKACPDYSKLQNEQSQGNIRKYGKTRNGTQRYQCKHCRETFTATKGTLFYRRRTPTQKLPGDDWQYLQMVKLRENGRVVGTELRVIYGDEETVLQHLGKSTAYIERTHLTMRHFNSRLTRKTLAFSKSLAMHKASSHFTRHRLQLGAPVEDFASRSHR